MKTKISVDFQICINVPLKSTVDKLDVDKLKPAPLDLKKLSDIVDKEVFKNQNIIQIKNV